MPETSECQRVVAGSAPLVLGQQRFPVVALTELRRMCCERSYWYSPMGVWPYGSWISSIQPRRSFFSPQWMILGAGATSDTCETGVNW